MGKRFNSAESFITISPLNTSDVKERLISRNVIKQTWSESRVIALRTSIIFSRLTKGKIKNGGKRKQKISSSFIYFLVGNFMQICFAAPSRAFLLHFFRFSRKCSLHSDTFKRGNSMRPPLLVFASWWLHPRSFSQRVKKGKKENLKKRQEWRKVTRRQEQKKYMRRTKGTNKTKLNARKI